VGKDTKANAQRGINMPKLKKTASKKAKKAKLKKVFEEEKEGKLHSGSKTGPLVTSRKQTIAIALSEAGMSKKKKKKSKK